MTYAKSFTFIAAAAVGRAQSVKHDVGPNNVRADEMNKRAPPSVMATTEVGASLSHAVSKIRASCVRAPRRPRAKTAPVSSNHYTCTCSQSASQSVGPLVYRRFCNDANRLLLGCGDEIRSSSSSRYEYTGNLLHDI